MKCQQQLSVRSSVGVLEAPSGYALRDLQGIKAKRTIYLLQTAASPSCGQWRWAVLIVPLCTFRGHEYNKHYHPNQWDKINQ